MKLDKLVGERFKERPADCVIESHAIMMRGGYIKQVGPGIYSSYTVMLRINRKIEQIVREEMEDIDAQEVQFPVTMPASLWEESGRYESVGPELLRFKDRNDTPMILGMTHEEPAVQLVREYGQSYTKYPFTVYQIQTKFRDEARPRAGLIRGREFMMKDAYSFHTSQEDLDRYYDLCHKKYERIFARAGIPQVISVKSESGMMGGSVAHEFILLTPAGEDTIIICESCGFKANLEAIGEEGACPKCKSASIQQERGIELGNIFQLGTKYTESMGMQYTDQNGNLQYPVMGCYGIGIGRTAASVCEVSSDERGPIWPMSIAPWQVHLCCMRADDPAVKEVADNLYDQLQKAGLEVIYDDRVVSAGVMFSDADLLGIPIRVICSPRNLKENKCEIATRDKSLQEQVEINSVLERVKELAEKFLQS